MALLPDTHPSRYLLPSRHPVGPKCSSEQRKRTLISPNCVSLILISSSKQDYGQTALCVSLLINCLDRVVGNSCGGLDALLISSLKSIPVKLAKTNH